jgi:hypothetical protein
MDFCFGAGERNIDFRSGVSTFEWGSTFGLIEAIDGVSTFALGLVNAISTYGGGIDSMRWSSHWGIDF